MNEQVLIWMREFLSRVDLNAKEIPAYSQVMMALDAALQPPQPVEVETVNDDE